MGSAKIKLNNWPFLVGEKANLIWIGEPFKKNNKWMINTYFHNGKEVKEITQDWANIHFLSINKIYKDGYLNSSEVTNKSYDNEIIDIDLSNIKAKYYESDWQIRNSNYKSKSRTFNFYKEGVSYSIPLIEIIRSVLAPNTFMLNSILYNDIFEDYCTYDINQKILNLYFTKEYKQPYLKEEYIHHLAWIIGNKDVLEMINQIGYSNNFKRKILFDFYLKNFKFKARVKKNNNKITILEIINLKSKRIDFDEIRVFHPSFENKESSNKSKTRTFMKLSKDNEKVIDGEMSGSTSSDEKVNEEILIHEYENNPKIIKEKVGFNEKREEIDENTKKFILEDDNKRTFASFGGIDKAKGLEVSNYDIKELNSDLKEFMEVLEELKKMIGIKNVTTEITPLPLGRRFSYLKDGISRRKVLIATVNYNDKIFKIIEVEREEKSLSTLILTSEKEEDFFNKKIKEMLKLLIVENGSWTSYISNNIEKYNIKITKVKHLNKRKYEIMKNIFNKLN
ncbi:Tn7-like element transposition protein TnsE [Clostridium tertium]|uniref:Tn7-like element transposition protein TnsE n=1 Tax=Clostridium tertium TaxID=1559 RepID=UPI001C1E031C|nr:Tn7-like element transposition protein TnsE [Clostridium tertium]MBU6134016.1 hypothetical protein [Clostridium tertium]